MDQYSHVAPRLSGQTSIWTTETLKICNFDPKTSEPCLQGNGLAKLISAYLLFFDSRSEVVTFFCNEAGLT